MDFVLRLAWARQMATVNFSETQFYELNFFYFSLQLPAGVKLGKNGEVSASFGGYSASAGLAGPNGGLHAEAATPDGPFAAAGLGGMYASYYTLTPSNANLPQSIEISAQHFRQASHLLYMKPCER